MGFRQFLINKLILFFMLTTLITLAMSVIGSAFDSEARFGYDALLSPLVFAGCCVLPTFVTYSRRELTIRELLPRMVLELLLIEAVVLGLILTSPVVDTTGPAVPVVAGSVLVIYALVYLFDWLRESAEAKRMNEDLQAFRRAHGTDD